jgi:hypothetical protein
MNPKDKKNYKQIKEIVRNLEPGVYSEKRIEELIRESGVRVQNMSSVLQVLTQTPYLEQLTNGNYMRTKR